MLATGCATGAPWYSNLRHERYDGEDWAQVEGLDAIRNVLVFGNTSPRYANTLVGVSFALSLGR